MPTFEVCFTDSGGKRHITTVEANSRDEAADAVFDEQDADTVDEVNEIGFSRGL